MKEDGIQRVLAGIYRVRLYNGTAKAEPINIFLIPGGKGRRSLMIDTGFKKHDCLAKMDSALSGLGITYSDLDIFMTHKHHDHSGLASEYADLGARIFMNPEENRHHYDCLYYNHDHGGDEEQYRVLRSVGVTPEGTPQIWAMFKEIRRRVRENKGWEYEVHTFPNIPVMDGQVFRYGEYSFEARHLRGHTYGQMGLLERSKRIFFCADQVIDGISPIVATTYPDEHLLWEYFASLRELKEHYGTYVFYPAHKEAFDDVSRVVNRIVYSYIDKIELIRQILERGGGRHTVREIACLAYGMDHIPASTGEFVKLKMIMSKTFSCLEYLRDQDFAIREEENGTFYFSSPLQ